MADRPLRRCKPKSHSRLPVDPSKLNMGNTYSLPPLYYYDQVFTCKDCGSEEKWTAAQQKWWYEQVGGYFFSRAVRCRPCRKQEKARQAAARKTHREGL